jgi:proton-translocating NADH-quinone oxidoreductase chain N
VLPLLILIPMAGLLILSLLPKGGMRHLLWGFALLMCLAQVAVAIAGGFQGQQMLGFHLELTDLGRVMLLSVGIVLAAVLLVGLAMVEKPRLEYFSGLVLVSLIGMNGMTLVRDLFTLYVFLEVTSVGSFVLIAFNRDKLALEGAFKYLILSAVATVLMLGGVALLVMVVGKTGYADVKAALTMDNWPAKLAVAGFVCGALIKGGVVPFHGWVLGAYSAASAPVSVLLAGIATKASGIFSLIVVTTEVFPPSEAISKSLLAAGALSIVVGALAAIGQKDIKRLLAYSSISQVGYIVLGLGAGLCVQAGCEKAAKLALAGAILHLFNHAIFKSLLFVTSSSLEQRAGTTNMEKMGGLDSRMRITSFTSILASLSTAGVPPLSGFWSKLLIIMALWQEGHTTYAVIAVLLSVVTLAYLLRMQRKVFFGRIVPAMEGVKEASASLLVPAVGLAGITVAVGLFCPFMAETFLMNIKSLF